MTINYTTLLGLAKPVTGTEAGAWGDVVNDQITTLVEDAVANAASISVTSGDVTLTTTSGSSNQARMSILLITGTPGTTRNVIAPSQSKVYQVINSSNAAVVIKGSATTGATIAAGASGTVAWNGSDFVEITATSSGRTFNGNVTVNGTIRAQAASTQDAVVLQGRSGGTSSYEVTLTPTTLSADRTVTLQDSSLTMAGTDVAQTFTAVQTFTPAARTSGASPYFTVTTPADTGQTASTESIGSSFTAATRTWATGALTLQRERVFAAPTYAFSGSSTLATAINVDIAAPIAGSNATITNAWALRAASSLFVGSVRTEAASTQDAVILAGRAGGTSSYGVTITPATLSASRTFTLPDATTTAAGLAVSQTFTGVQTFTPDARSSGAASYFTLTTPADTNQTASTEAIGANFTAGTRTWAGGTLTLQRERVFAAPTYAFAGASTLTTAVNVDIANPVAGTNATITNAWALRAAASLFTDAVTMSATTQNLALGTSQTSGTWTAGGASQTGTLTLDQSTKTHTLNIGSGATESAATKTINIGTGGVSTSTTSITIGSTNGTTVNVNGAAVFSAGTAAAPAITTSGDTNTGIFFPAADTIAFAEGGTEAMRIDSDGDVGIGTSSPSQKLHVVGRTLGVQNATYNDTTAYGFSFQNASTSTLQLWGGYDSAVGGFIQATNVGVAHTNLLLNPNGGNVGIGTSSPLGALDVFKTSSAVGYVRTSNQTLKLTADDSGSRVDIANAASSAISFTTGITERARITSGGDFSVGTTGSGARVTIRGETSDSTKYTLLTEAADATDQLAVRCDGAVYMGLDGASPYNLTTGTAANATLLSDGFFYRSTSSIKYNQNVQNAVHGLAEVMTLRPVTYQGKADVDAGKTFGGLIAEEVHAAGLTEFVQYADDGSPDALSYGHMVSLCIKAIQELKTELDSVKAELASLKGA